jgi:ADP-heptose:LPS heptosyltransferase
MIFNLIFFKLTLFFFKAIGFFNYKKNHVAVICCPLYIGDMIFLFPLIRALKENDPNRKIIFLCKEEFKSLLVLNPDIDDVRIVRKSAINVLKNYWAIVNATFFYTPMADYWKRLAHAVHAKNIISFDSSKNFKVLKSLNIPKAQHVSEYLLELLPSNESIKINSKPFLNSSLNYSDLLIIQCDGRNLNIKSFTEDQLNQIIKIASEFPVKIQLMGLYKPAKEFNLPNIIDLRGQSNFDDWIKYILGARFVIGLDSAAAQLRKAIGKSAYILMGPADNFFFGNTRLFPGITIISNDNLTCRDRKFFQGQFFETLSNCQKNKCDNSKGRECIDGKIFDAFISSIRKELSADFEKIN